MCEEYTEYTQESGEGDGDQSRLHTFYDKLLDDHRKDILSI